MELSQLYQKHEDLVHSLFQEGFLDEQFTQLQQLQDESSPFFVEEVAALFLQDAIKLLSNLQNILNQEPVDYKKVDTCLHHLKGSSSSIGAYRLKNICIIFKAYCQERMREGCLRCLRELGNEYNMLKEKLEFLLQMERQIVKAGGSISFEQ